MKKIETLEPDFQPLVENLLMGAEIATGLKWIVTNARRTMAEQKAIFEQPTDGKDNDRDGKIDEADEMVSKAPPGSSAHNYGLAADLAPMKDGKIWWNAPDAIWRAMADVAVKLGLTAGYYFKSFKDMPHVEHPRWKIEREKWKAGEIQLP